MTAKSELSTTADRMSFRRFVLAGIATFLGLAMTWVVMTAKSAPEAGAPPERPSPMVSVFTAEPATHQLLVASQGTIEAKHRVSLVAQVAGKVASISERFADGAFFSAGDVLLTVEDDDYTFALARAQSAKAAAEQRLAEERGRALQAEREWRELGSVEANDLFLRKPQLHAAELAVVAAQADVDAAQLALERTIIRAPFDGRIQATDADIGQFVATGSRLAQIYGRDALEVRLPLSNSQLSLLPDAILTSETGLVGLKADFNISLGGKEWTWQAPIVRVEAEVDRRTRVTNIIAEFPAQLPGIPALTPGMFVQASIQGAAIEGVVVVSNDAVSPDGHVLAIDEESRLKRVPIQVISRRSNEVFVSGLRSGELVVSELNNAMFPGLAVKPQQTNTEVN